MRKIPVTMATQHPDNAGPAYWNNKEFMNTADEIDEAYECWSNLGVHEYMWDWEGKFVDESVIDKLFRSYYEFFQERQIGRDIFLTYRIPNIWKESGHRLMRAFMNIISVAELSKEFGYEKPPVFEVILPMAENVKQMMYIKEKYRTLADIMPSLMEHSFNNSNFHIEVIPLFEDVKNMVTSVDIIDSYAKGVKNLSGKLPKYLRVFLARSDPAMNSGIIPSVLAVKAAISEYKRYEQESGIKTFLWMGGGSLPFRGNVSPYRINEVIAEYQGLSSITVQSSFRYDHDLPLVKKAIKNLNINIPKNINNYIKFSPKDIEKLKTINDLISPLYRNTVESIANMINDVAAQVPSRRERILHVGLFGYSRGIGKVRLPRAIKFTASLYSLGIPPEFIGTGRALKLLKEKKLLSFVEERYLNLKKDLAYAYGFLNQENLKMLCDKNPKFLPIAEDVEIIKKYLGPLAINTKTEHILHRNEVSSLYHLFCNEQNFQDNLVNAAKIRKSLG